MSVVVLIFGVTMIVAAALISPSALHNLTHGLLFYAIVGLGLPFVGWQTFLTYSLSRQWEPVAWPRS